MGSGLQPGDDLPIMRLPVTVAQKVKVEGIGKAGMLHAQADTYPPADEGLGWTTVVADTGNEMPI